MSFKAEDGDAALTRGAEIGSLAYLKRYWHGKWHKPVRHDAGLECDSEGSPGCGTRAHRWTVSENRSLPCMNSSNIFQLCQLGPTWTHMTSRHNMQH